jgi:hypothetical protein
MKFVAVPFALLDSGIADRNARSGGSGAPGLRIDEPSLTAS